MGSQVGEFCLASGHQCVAFSIHESTRLCPFYMCIWFIPHKKQTPLSERSYPAEDKARPMSIPLGSYWHYDQRQISDILLEHDIDLCR